VFKAEVERIAAELAQHAIRRGRSAAWIGLDWLGDSEVFQLVGLGPDLYNGATGIALFLAAHGAVSGHAPSTELALAGVAHIRRNLTSRSAARFARSLGIGAATGLGSIVYGFCVIAKCAGQASLLQEAERAAQLFTDELIAADKQLDVMGGAAGAILALLRLHRDTQSDVALARAIVFNPSLLLLDEPFGALDPITRAELQFEFRKLQQKLRKTIVFVSHDVAEALMLGDRIALMDAGRLCSLDTPDEFLASQNVVAQGYLAAFRAGYQALQD